ncbi:MAG: hypothetical protein QME96_13865, partial [Myxococcota bacterium]|nr:hypothetical protein [Myxococcota bacterium]
MSRDAPAFDRTPIRPDRVPRIDGSFVAIPHRFLRDGFWASLEHHELLLYFLLALVADRQGMSFYYGDRLASILRFVLEDFVSARTGLLRKDLIAHDRSRHQILSLPPHPVVSTAHRAAAAPPAPPVAPT